MNRTGTRFGNSGIALFNVEVSKNGWYSLTRLDVFILGIRKSLPKRIARTDEGFFYRRCPYVLTCRTTSLTAIGTVYEINSVPYYRFVLPVKLKFIAKKSFKHCPLMFYRKVNNMILMYQLKTSSLQSCSFMFKSEGSSLSFFNLKYYMKLPFNGIDYVFSLEYESI